MSDLSKKIAMFSQKAVNNSNNNNNNNKDNKKKDNNKNEKLKYGEINHTKNAASYNTNINTNNKFQNRISIFEKNNIPVRQSLNRDNNKKEIEKKKTMPNSINRENDLKKISSERNFYDKENAKRKLSEKINFFSSNKKEIESKNYVSERKNKKEIDSNLKLTSEEKINIFDKNKKDNESKIKQFDKKKTISTFSNNKNQGEKKDISERINMFSNYKNNQARAVSAKNFNTFKFNKKENESKMIQNKNNTSINKNENSNKNENNNNISSGNNNKFISNFRNIIDKFNNSKTEKKENDLGIRKSHPNNLNNLKNNNIHKNNTITDNKINNVNKNTNNIMNNKTNINSNVNNNDINSNLNIDKIQEENINESKKIEVNSPLAPRSTPIYASLSTNNQNEDEIGQIFIASNVIPETVINESFCMAFFMTSFNIENPQIIENSSELSSDCGHVLCTSALAIKPEIIFRYPQKDTKDFEISELGASICFPNGIKICYDSNEMHIRPLKNYSSILTNQNGKRYYMMTYHYYLKISSKEISTNTDYFSSLNYQLSNSLNTNEYIYIPYCLSLLSKYPFFNQMEKCLESMRFTLENYTLNPSEIYNLIIYYLKSIPIPPIGTKLFFPIPYYKEIISINQPFYKDVILFGDNPIVLLEYLSVEEIILVFRLLLFEQKIIIVGNNYDSITQFTYNFILLLYPFQWVHTYISIITEKMMKYLNSFLPFFFGMHISLYELSSNILESIKEDIFIININNHTFELNTYPNLNTKSVIKKINEIVPQLPKNIHNNIKFGLGFMKSYYDKKKEQKEININNIEENLNISIKIKQVFIQAFIEILYDYKNFLTVIGNKPIFNTNGLLEKRPKNEANFYKELTETQLFQMFIQNNPVNADKNNETFFEEFLEIYSKLKLKADFRQEFINNCSITCEIYKYYIIKNDSLDKFDINNDLKINIKKKEELLTLNEYQNYIKKKYIKYENYFNPNIIMKINKKIINNKVFLEHSKIPSKYNYYIIPNQEFNFEVEKRKKSIRISKSNLNKIKENKNNKDNKENELTQEEKDDIKENIADVLTKIFKNEKLSDKEESKKLISDSLSTDYGKDLYTNILYENCNILNESSFKFLNDIIYNSIEKLKNIISKDKNMTYCVRLVKCCRNFRKEENKKYIFLSDILYPKFKKELKFIGESVFWKEWALMGVSEQKDPKKNINEKWVESLKDVEKTMGKMGFNKTMIYSTVALLAKENIKEEKIFLKHMKTVVENLKIFNY